MANKRITGRPGLLGYTYYYDETGRCVGKSRSGAFGTRAFFDEKGRRIGVGREGFLAKAVYHDTRRGRYIRTYEGIGGDVHFDSGRMIGRSAPGFLGTEYIQLQQDETATPCKKVCEERGSFNHGEERIAVYEADRRQILKNVLAFAICALLGAVIWVVATI